MIVHIVMFKFKDENKKENIKEVSSKLNALVELIPTLNSMEVGVDFSRSERAFDMSIYTTFDSKEALSEYAVHPEHLKVVELIKSVTLESKVVDYIKEDSN
ncbi:Dabb family protein [Sulfurimonas sp.]|uniref:Dabb family protein n=1 Tax=Sulfurimonas sp. TaxID=2022749 RepID=UPI00262EA86B|nr:Dabb family protein [Sulfurimonas sp.]MCW8894295.1 Dabb family protein [Sulfurimonas sp.]MCW9068015.1 Dabb family protein [Sulfurimonas sp.]